MNRVNFNRVARVYRWLEYGSFGPALAHCRNAQLLQLKHVRRALVLGDGDGRFLKCLLTSNGTLEADVVDSSDAMLRLLQQRSARDRHRICLHHADALEWKPPSHYDLIVTHFFLDCFFPHEVGRLMDSLLRHALPGAQWVISEFAIPRNPFAAAFARGLIRSLYCIFGLLTGLRVRHLPDYAAALSSRGLILRRQRCYLGGLLCSQVWCLPPHFHQRK